MKKALSMALTAAMMMVMCVTAFAAGADAAELPSELPTVDTGWLNTIIDFFADLLRTLGEIIGIIFK